MKMHSVKVFGIKRAMTGMRYPKNSERMSDSTERAIGDSDMRLLKALTMAGRDHRKALRMVHIQASVTMPISWWIQYDTYKVATVANSRSRMHKMGSRRLAKADFYVSRWTADMESILLMLNGRIDIYLSTKCRRVWHEIIDILPMSYQQERMVDINYETALAILNSRYNEKLADEWRFFCDNLLRGCHRLDEIWRASKGEK